MPTPLILCYHAIGSHWTSSLAVPEETLDRQLSLLRRRGYVGLTFAEAERRRLSETVPERTVVVTFDDGFASVLLAAPVLEAAGFPATVFVPTRFVDTGEPLSFAQAHGLADGAHTEALRPLSWEELADLRDRDWEVGSHTVTHPRLTTLDDNALREELELSREAIQRRLGACTTVAYPYGHADARVAAAAERAGYLAACTLTATHRIDERFLRARVGLYPFDTGLRFRAKVSPVLRRLRRTALADLAGRARVYLNSSEHK
jgi:peptidoglycan/xylan/chitin deacetylase (PgdA/CDA1 family)